MYFVLFFIVRMFSTLVMMKNALEYDWSSLFCRDYLFRIVFAFGCICMEHYCEHVEVFSFITVLGMILFSTLFS